MLEKLHQSIQVSSDDGHRLLLLHWLNVVWGMNMSYDGDKAGHVFHAPFIGNEAPVELSGLAGLYPH